MQIYKTENNIIIENKTVNEPYECQKDEKEGIAPYPVGYDITTGKLPSKTEKENYEGKRKETLADLAKIKENMDLGIATERDFEKRQAQWLAYHNAYIGNGET